MGLTACAQCQAGTVQTGSGMLASSKCMACTAGTYQTGMGVTSISFCARCVEGTYQTGLGMALASRCIPCQSGTFQPFLGQTFAAACQACQRGKYQTGLGGSSSGQCMECSTGTFQSSLAAGRRENCTLCPAGTFLVITGATHVRNCTLCPPGTYQTGLGVVASSNCSLCGAGTYESATGNPFATCTRCRAGTYQTGLGVVNATVCVECAPGSYQTGLGATHSSQCVLCSPGTFLTESGASSRVTSCKPCMAGTFQTGLGATAIFNCSRCEAGGYQTGTGMASSAACIPCSAGTYQSASGATSGENCQLCGVGTYQPMLGGGSSLSCVLCARGTYQTGIGMALESDCQKCVPGFFQPIMGATGILWCTPCQAGTYSSLEGAGYIENCTRCGPGSYQTGVGATRVGLCVRCDAGHVQADSSPRADASDCLPCIPGTYASSPTAGACQPCEAGRFQTGYRQINCSLCRAGTFQPFTRVRYESWCAPCERGMYQSELGASSIASCISCNRGSFASETGGVSACTACSAGAYVSAYGSQRCLDCLSGTYASQRGAMTCDACSPGTYGNQTSRSGCASCPMGQFQRLNGSSACLLCLPGRFQTALGSAECDACAAGGFQDAGGQTQCTLCPPGYFQPDQGSTVCPSCVAGGFQTGAGALQCSSCRQGTYHQRIASTTPFDCENCSAGFYGVEAGVSYCASCNPGSYTGDPGQIECRTCEAGRFQNASNSTRCHRCPTGLFATSQGLIHLDQCVRCVPGYYASRSGATTCDECNPGTFQTGVAASQCEDCAAGTYMGFFAWDSLPCALCAAGTFSTQIGAASDFACTLCPDGFFSLYPGQNSSGVCQICPLGTVSISTKSDCSPCASGTYCPPGYHVPIQCVPGLLCENGTDIVAPPGFLPVLRENCTGMIPCPPGTNCTISGWDKKGILEPFPNRTHFVVWIGGAHSVDMSCQGVTLAYGYSRVDPADNHSDYGSILFWLEPLGCHAGAYLLGSACVPCPQGSYSPQPNSVSVTTCRACPPGSYGASHSATRCDACQPGRYGPYGGLSSCYNCSAGSYQIEPGATLCQLCPPGEFSGAPMTITCTPCPAGAAQALPGATHCPACNLSQFSSSGDVRCSQCGAMSTGLDPGYSCPVPVLPQNTSVVWLTVRGVGNGDDCIGVGPSRLSPDGSLLSVSVSLLYHQARCAHKLLVMSRPDLTRSWEVQSTPLRRPVAMRVVAHNETFYPALCVKQGFGAVFTLEDEYGNMHTDLSNAKATISILDFTGQNQLYSMGCTRLPSQLGDLVPLGACYVPYCPRTRVMIRITVIWTGGSVRGDTLVSPGPSIWCAPTSSWVATLELQNPSIPYFPGGLITVFVRALNSPSRIIVFKFALTIPQAVASFVSFTSVYSTVYRMEQDTLSVVGDSSQGTGTILGVLTLRIRDSAVIGLNSVLQVVPSSFQITLLNTIPYDMFVRAHGFLCRSDGDLYALVDKLRVTSLLSNARRKTLVHWSKIQGGSGQSFPTSVNTIGVQNVMKGWTSINAQCTSLHPSDLIATPTCNSVQAAGIGQGNQAAALRVQYQSVSTYVIFTVYVPQNISVWTAASERSGRFKLFTVLQAGNLTIHNVDATPYVSLVATQGPVSVADEQWTCMPSMGMFTIGDPVLLSGVCDTYKPPPATATAFLFTGGVANGMGMFTLSRAVLGPETPAGGLVLLSGVNQLPLPATSVSVVSASSLDRVSSGSPMGLSLVLSGASARCAPVTFSNNITALIPVFPPSPKSLRLTLSATTLVSRNETFTGLIPVSTGVVQALLVFADSSTLDVRMDPRFRMASSSSLLDVSGLNASTGMLSGNGTLIFTLEGMPCVTTLVSVRVLAFSVASNSLVCPACPSVLTTVEDPLSMQYPLSYPSSIDSGGFVMRKVLSDGRIIYKSEPIAVSGNGSLVSGRILAVRAGYVTVSANTTAGVQSYQIPILDRWVVAWRLMCNRLSECSPGMNLAPPGDGAGLPPFSYSSRLVLSLSVTLVDSSVALFDWLSSASVMVNQTELAGANGKEVPLTFGALDIHVRFDSRWRLAVSELHVILRVDRLASLEILGPSVLYQLHCSLIWEEGNYTVRGNLTDGTTRILPHAGYTTTEPLVIRAGSYSLIHADWAGTGQITAVFGQQYASVWVQATVSSRYFTGVGLDFIPTQWSAALGQPLPIQPDFLPLLWESPAWFDLTNLTARVVQCVSSNPDVVRVTPVSLYLLADYYQSTRITVNLIQCGAAPHVVASKDFVVNVAPNQAGQVDIGQENGLPVIPVAKGQSMGIPVYLFAPMPLRSYAVEIYLPSAAFDPTDCVAGLLVHSQCAVVMGPSNNLAFRAVGGMMHSQLTGRLWIATIHGRPLADALVTMRVRVLQSVFGEQILGTSDTMFALRLGTGTLPIGYQYLFLLPSIDPVPNTENGVYGDTDGDGLFTSLDVLFMERYTTVSIFGGEQRICVVASRCQLVSQLTPWQLMQLNPVRNPNVPATTTDGSDVLFLLRALVGKAYFLESLDIQSRAGVLIVSLTLRDYAQQLNPFNAAAQVQIYTNANGALAFDSASEYNSSSSILTVDCVRTDQRFAITSLPTAITVDEPSVGIRVITQALDLFGSLESASSLDRRFMFLPAAPLASFNVLASRASLLQETTWVDYLPSTSCQTLCDDASLFIDNALGAPSWLNDTTVTATFALYAPKLQGYWPFSMRGYVQPATRYEVGIPANVPALDAVLVGMGFNLTFQAPSGITMGLFRVESTYASLLRVYDGAEAVGNTFFMNTARTSTAFLQLVLKQAGVGLPIRITMVNSLPFEIYAANTFVRTTYVTGFVPVITALRLEILCQSGVILWSELGGTDEACDVLIVPLWTPAVSSSPGIRVTCKAYPCILQGFSQTVRPVIQTYVPVNPRIMVQRPLFSIGERVQWRAVCDLRGFFANVTVTQRALLAGGVIRTSPANALIITRDAIKGGKLGRAVVRFGNSSAGLTVTEAVDLPISLQGFIFSGIRVDSTSQSVTASFQVGPLRGGQRGYVLVRAYYAGGYSMLLDPRPAPGGVALVNASNDAIPSQLDGSFTVRVDAEIGAGRSLITVLYQGLSLTLQADIIAPDAVVPTNNNNASTVIAATATAVPVLLALPDTVTPDVKVVEIYPGRLAVSLVGSGNISAFYLQLRVEGPVSITGCVGGRDLPLFSDCLVNSALYPSGGFILAGASQNVIRNNSDLAFIDYNSTLNAVTGIWGFLEVCRDSVSTRFPVITGRRGYDNPMDPISSMMPGLPVIDSDTLNSRYREMFSGDSILAYKAIFTLYALTGKQRIVDIRLYSNEFELSAMFRVMDRFLRPDTRQITSLQVLFHTDQLPTLPGSTVIPGVGLQVPASHALDGWYIVEWRQQIPAINGLSVTFTLETTALPYAWPWDAGNSLVTGSRMPSCPRAATDIGTFVMSYEITSPVDISQALLDQIACSVQVPGRRLLLSAPDVNGRRTLSITLESLARVHQANLIMMGEWIARQLLLPENSSYPVRRGILHYTNDTTDPPVECPVGYFITKNGTYQHLPMHAFSGPGCYGLACVDGYTLAAELEQCIPMPVSTDLIWVCVFVVLSLIIAVSGVVFCVQTASWGAPIEEVVFDPAAAVNSETRESCETEDIFFDADMLYNRENMIITGVILDDYSAMMLDDDDFEPVPLDP